MKFWGTSINPRNAEKYEISVVDDILPPANNPYRPAIDVPSVTKEHNKPTAFLPVDNAIPIATPSPTNHTQQEEYKATHFFVETSHMVCSHKTLFGSVVGIVILALVGGAVYLKKRQQQHGKKYSALPEAVGPMNHLGDGYGAEPASLVPSAGFYPWDRVFVGLGFHSSFLDDDSLSTATTVQTARYRDEPGSNS
ncbi:hypothetical protein C0993_003014, partial [Termitomyces sp. T159_Od127]